MAFDTKVEGGLDKPAQVVGQRPTAKKRYKIEADAGYGRSSIEFYGFSKSWKPKLPGHLPKVAGPNGTKPTTPTAVSAMAIWGLKSSSSSLRAGRVKTTAVLLTKI